MTSNDFLKKETAANASKRAAVKIESLEASSQETVKRTISRAEEQARWLEEVFLLWGKNHQ